jgi:hypothetical protein
MYFTHLFIHSIIVRLIHDMICNALVVSIPHCNNNNSGDGSIKYLDTPRKSNKDELIKVTEEVRNAAVPKYMTSSYRLERFITSTASAPQLLAGPQRHSRVIPQPSASALQAARRLGVSQSALLSATVGGVAGITSGANGNGVAGAGTGTGAWPAPTSITVDRASSRLSQRSEAVSYLYMLLAVVLYVIWYMYALL